jgi:hydroxymethylpyrimidine/phosphomethylpyrimidine kinase
MNDYPIALTIAGSDSGGGAGIQADLKTFLTHSVFGTSVLTCITAQNPGGVSGIQEISTDMVEKQLAAVTGYFPVAAIKTGMLFSKEIIDTVAGFLKGKDYKIVVDPVMVATSGAKLLKDDAIESMKKNLIPIASLFTPNLDEGGILNNEKISSEKEMESGARKLFDSYGVPVLLKGGHLGNSEYAVDFFFNGKTMYPLSSKFVKEFNPHGTGCTYSAAITSNLAKGMSLVESISLAKYYIFEAISQSYTLGRTNTLNHNPITIK